LAFEGGREEWKEEKERNRERRGPLDNHVIYLK